MVEQIKIVRKKLRHGIECNHIYHHLCLYHADQNTVHTCHHIAAIEKLIIYI